MFKVGQRVIRKNVFARRLVVGNEYIIARFERAGLVLQGLGNYVYEINNFDPAPPLVVGNEYEFSNSYTFDDAQVRHMLADMSDLDAYKRAYLNPLVTLSKDGALRTFKYARAISLTPCRVYGYDLMITPEEAANMAKIKLAADQSVEACAKLQEDLVGKYANADTKVDLGLF
tara:strand:- start:432 stop:950 length:519 start_codon:yes stop_codon:yes gene_type:complete